MSNGIDCWRCGAHNMDPPYYCPKGGDLDDTDETNSGHFADGHYYKDGWCDINGDGQDVLIRCDESMIDPANTAPHVQKYAIEKGYSVQIEWEVRADGNGKTRDVVVCFDPDAPEKATVLGQWCSQCVRRLDDLMAQ